MHYHYGQKLWEVAYGRMRTTYPPKKKKKTQQQQTNRNEIQVFWHMQFLVKKLEKVMGFSGSVTSKNPRFFKFYFGLCQRKWALLYILLGSFLK